MNKRILFQEASVSFVFHKLVNKVTQVFVISLPRSQFIRIVLILAHLLHIQARTVRMGVAAAAAAAANHHSQRAEAEAERLRRQTTLRVVVSHMKCKKNSSPRLAHADSWTGLK